MRCGAFAETTVTVRRSWIPVLGRPRARALGRGLALYADKQLLIEHRQDAAEHRDGRDVLTDFQLRDERMRGADTLGDLLLGRVELVAPLTDVGSDPVLLRNARIAAYSSFAAWYPGLRRARLLDWHALARNRSDSDGADSCLGQSSDSSVARAPRRCSEASARV